MNTSFLNSEKYFSIILSRTFGESVNKLKFPNIDKEYAFNMNDLKMLNVLHTSYRHRVIRYLHEPTNKKIVSKFFRIPIRSYGEETKSAENEIVRFLNEIKTIHALTMSPYIVGFYGICLYEHEALLCMESMNFSLYELYILVHQKGVLFPENIIGFIVISIINALIVCEENEIIHRDVKPGNILLNFEGQIKLGDFGESRLTNGIFYR